MPTRQRSTRRSTTKSASCSKSRGALEILEQQGVTHDVVRYLDTPPDRATIERILDAIPDEPQALVRTDDAKFKALGIAKSDAVTREQVIAFLEEIKSSV